MITEILSDREYPFGTILFLVTAPINAIFIFGMMLKESFDYSFLFDLVGIEFYIFNFTISLCGLYLVFVGREWDGDCF